MLSSSKPEPSVIESADDTDLRAHLLLVVPAPLRPDDLVGAAAPFGVAEAAVGVVSLAAAAAPSMVAGLVASFCFSLSAAKEDGCGCCFLPFFTFS